MASESEKELSLQSVYHVCILELMLVFAYTSFPFCFDARLWGLILTYVSDQFLHGISNKSATRSNCLKIACIMMSKMKDRDANAFLFQ